MSPIYRRPLSMLLAGSVLAIAAPGVAAAAAANTTTLSAASAEAWTHPRVPTAYMVPAGYGPVRVALERIVPEPYTIEVARSVPENMVIVWHAGDDWMKVLRQALRPMGLAVDADWNRNIIRISGGDTAFTSPLSPRRSVAAEARATPTVGHGEAAAEHATSMDRHARGLVYGHLYSDGSAGPRINASRMADGRAPTPSSLAWPRVPQVRVYVKGGNNKAPVLVAAPFARGLAPHVVPKLHAAPTPPFGSTPYTIKTGTMLSAGLTQYVDGFGWSIRWKLAADYRLDAPFPIPAGSLAHGLKYVFKAYQAQGGLLGDGFILNEPNKVAVIHKLSMPSIPGEGN